MGYGLVYDDIKEIASYDRLRQEMDEMKKDVVRKQYPFLGISQMD